MNWWSFNDGEYIYTLGYDNKNGNSIHQCSFRHIYRCLNYKETWFTCRCKLGFAVVVTHHVNVAPFQQHEQQPDSLISSLSSFVSAWRLGNGRLLGYIIRVPLKWSINTVRLSSDWVNAIAHLRPGFEPFSQKNSVV